MITANISTVYTVPVIPTVMRYGMTKPMYENDGILVCDISYQILATKYHKQVSGLDEEGNTTTETVAVDFASPVLFHEETKTIPYQLYLLIEQYRLTKSVELLQQINMALTQFEFQGSLSEFVLQVDSIQ